MSSVGVAVCCGCVGMRAVAVSTLIRLETKLMDGFVW